MKRRKRTEAEKDTLGPFGIIVFLGLLIIGPIYEFLGPLTWVLAGVVLVSGLFAGVHWLLFRRG